MSAGWGGAGFFVSESTSGVGPRERAGLRGCGCRQGCMGRCFGNTEYRTYVLRGRISYRSGSPDHCGGYASCAARAREWADKEVAIAPKTPGKIRSSTSCRLSGVYGFRGVPHIHSKLNLFRNERAVRIHRYRFGRQQSRVHDTITAMDANNHRKQKDSSYSLSFQSIPLDDTFPIFMFSFSVSDTPIRNLHCHDVYEFGICVQGNGIFVIGSEINPYEAGDTIVIAPGVYHRAKSGHGVTDRWYFIYFFPDQWSQLDLKRDTGMLIHYNDVATVFDMSKLLVDAFVEREEHFGEDQSTMYMEPRTRLGSEEEIRGIVRALVAQIHRIQIDRHPSVGSRVVPRTAIDERINRAIDILVNSGTAPLSISEVARASGLSEPQFRHLFKEQVGIPPKRFQTKLRINLAIDLLKERKNRIVDVSELCGFASLSTFNRQFRAETGMSPMEWRSLRFRK
jgi:AraC-like DNA-binding protein/quercetin dioxygenase-like cupin family protein